MTNTKLLRKKIKESGYKLTFLAGKCGLTYQGFLNKINNVHEFTAREIKTLCDLLSIAPEEKELIFFASNVDE